MLPLSDRYTRFSASQALARANSFTKWDPGQCLNMVWNCLDVPNSADLYDANAAWAAATQKVYAGTPPAGAPVYFAGGKHGHIVISRGGGGIRSTDWPRLGVLGNTTINDICRDWGIRYLGWSRSYANHPIAGLQVVATPTIPAPAKYSLTSSIVIDDEALRQGRSSSAAKVFNPRVWSWLYWNGGSVGRSFCTANYAAWMKESASVFGPTSVKATQAAYRALNTLQPKGGWGGSLSATYPGPALLRVLGLRAD